MKKLFHFCRKLENCSGSLIFLTNRSPDASFEVVVDDSFDFLEFTPKKLSKLNLNLHGEQNALRSADGMIKFQNFVEQHLLMAEARSFLAFPSRILHQLFISRNLLQFLTPEQRSRLSRIFDDERSKIVNICQKKEWSIGETHRICAFFSVLQEKDDADEIDLKLKKEILSKMLEKGIELLFLFHLSCQNPENSKKLLDDEKLITLEICRIFLPKNFSSNKIESSWKAKFDFSGVDSNPVEFDEVLTNLSKNISNEVLSSENHRNSVYFWETIDEISEEIGIESYELTEKLKQSNAARFLAWADGTEEFSPSQIGMLRRLAKNFDNFSTKNLSRWKPTDDKKSFESLKSRLQDLEKKLEDAKQTQKILQERRSRKILSDNEWESLPEGAREKLRGVRKEFLETSKSRDDAMTELVELYEQLGENEKKIVDDAVDESAIRNGNVKFSSLDAEELANLVRDVGLTQKSEFSSKISDANSDNEKLREFSRKLQIFEQKSRQNDLNLSNFSSKLEALEPQQSDDARDGSISREIEKNEKEIKDLNDEIHAYQRDVADEEVFTERFDNPSQFANEIYENFLDKIQKRVAENQISSADLLFFLENEDVARSMLGDRKFDEILEIRKKVASIFDDVESNFLQSGEVQAFDEAGRARLVREFGGDVQRAFGREQSIHEFVDGIVRSFQGRIFEIVNSGAIDETKKNEILSKLSDRYRLHGFSEHRTTVELSEKGVVLYRAEKLHEQQVVEEGNRSLEQFVLDAVNRNQDVESDEFCGGKLSEQLNQIFEVRQNEFVHGKWLDDDYIPGADCLRTLKLQASPISEKITSSCNEIVSGVDAIRDGFAMAPQIENIQQRNQVVDLNFSKFQDLTKKWKNYSKNFLKLLLDEYEEIFSVILPKNSNGEIPGNFVRYFENLKKLLERLDESFQKIEELLSDREGLRGDESRFFDVLDDFYSLSNAVEFENGFWNVKFCEIEEDFRSMSFLKKNNVDADGKSNEFFDGAVYHLNRLDFFNGKDDFNYSDARKKFEDERCNFSKKYSKYKETVNGITNRIKRDMESFDDAEFVRKYSYNKEHASAILGELSTASSEFDEIWQKFNLDDEGGFWNEFEQKWKTNDPNSRSDALKLFQRWGEVAEWVGLAEKQADDYDEWIQKFDKVSKSEWRFGGLMLRRREYGVSWLSIKSIYQSVKQFLDARERKIKRDTDKMTGELGVAIFGKKTSVGKEFFRMLQHSEVERVNEFKDSYKDEEIWTIRDHLRDSNDQDEIRAIITLLNEKGNIGGWDDADVLNAINRLNSRVQILVPDDIEKMDSSDLRAKVSAACEGIWSREVFREWDSSLGNNIEKARGQWDSEFQEYEKSPTDRIRVLSGMLQKWANGDSKDVYPDKYEAFLHFAFEMGKINGQPDPRWYYLIIGATLKNPKTGKTLLSRDVFSRFNKNFLQSIPIVDFFIDKTSWKKDGEIVPEGTPGAHTGGWTYQDFLGWAKMLNKGNDGSYNPKACEDIKNNIEKFFYKNMLSSQDAQDRVRRTIRNTAKEADHDDAEMFFATLDSSQILQMIGTRSEGTQQATNDMWRMFLHGFPRYMINARRILDENDRKYGKDNKGWMKQRSKLLMQVGTRLHVALTTTQVLAGNKNVQNGRPLIFSDNEWENKASGESTAYSPNAKKSREQILTMMNYVFDATGNVPDEYRKAIAYNGYKFGQDYRVLEKTAGKEWEKMVLIGNQILSDRIGGRFFANEDAIESALRRYTSELRI